MLHLIYKLNRESVTREIKNSCCTLFLLQKKQKERWKT
nr:MAG TPA: hypothetical protein [Caudoviricetes sp.]